MATQRRNDELVDLLAADFPRAQMPFAMHNGVGGFYEHALSVSDDTTVTVFSSTSPYVVTDVLYYSVAPTYSADNAAPLTGLVVLDDAAELFNDGDTIIELRVTDEGAVEVQRTAGSQTLKLKLRLDWI